MFSFITSSASLYLHFQMTMLFPFQPPNQPQSRYSEPDNRDWRRPAQSFPSGESIRDNREFGGRYDFRQQDGSQFSRQDQLNNQFSRTQISSNQGVTI